MRYLLVGLAGVFVGALATVIGAYVALLVHYLRHGYDR